MNDRDQPNSDAFQSFAQSPAETPVVMLNLLKFKPGGEASYDAYLTAVEPLLAKVGGDVVYHGNGAENLIGRDDDGWDRVLLIRYPNRKALMEMANSAAYKAIFHLREAAVTASVLLATDPVAAG